MDVILESDETNHPLCPHGPTFLFQKTVAKRKPFRNFYGCSASRNRKFCPFFHWEDEPITDEKRKMWQVLTSDYIKTLNLTKLRIIQKKLENCTINYHLKFCKKCSLVLFSNEFSKHAQHGYIETIFHGQIFKPTMFLTPLEENKINAQYFFSEKCVRIVVESLKEFEIKRLICIGTPRIFEYVSSNDINMECLFMDIDHRYAQFFNPNQFIVYNLFNHHFFEGPSAEKCFTEFVQSKEATAILIDPPFGGMIKSIAHTLTRISSHRESEELMSILLFFPYFNEDRILKNLPTMKMLDYKVEYTNHDSFKKGGLKHGSPVRIYTNLNAKLFQLPADEGYRYCAICERYISRENKHCPKCNSCTSKDGRPYNHCDLCGRCCKSSWKHCLDCNRCALPQHSCGLEEKDDDGNNCFACHQPDHKHRNCPSKGHSRKSKKKR